VTEVFFGTICLITVRRSDSGRTDCRRCGRVDRSTYEYIQRQYSFVLLCFSMFALLVVGLLILCKFL